MDSPTPPREDWHEHIPDEETFEEIKRRLTDELQNAAVRLLAHLQASSLRMRIAGNPQGLYLTVGSGRHTDEHPPSEPPAIGSDNAWPGQPAQAGAATTACRHGHAAPPLQHERFDTKG